MSTASVSRETSPSETYVLRKLAELCARVQRAELLSRLATLALIVVGYACLIGWFDYFVGATGFVRWIGFTAFLSLFGSYFGVAVRTAFQRVNPYYVARQLEKQLPNSKNSLINWLDLHDEPLPSAFQNNLSARAAEQLQEGNPEIALRQRQHWFLLGITALPAIGLFVLFLLGPAAFFASMLQAFAPFYSPSNAARTQITLLEPAGGNAEVSSTESVAIAARIEGRVPASDHPAGPKLHYRYQSSEDFLTFPLQRNVDGIWTIQLFPAQLRTGLSYKITAGDAETPLHQIAVRGRLHATKFEVTYRHRPYRNSKTVTRTFTSKPPVNGMRGTEVEFAVYANRPVQSAKIELLLNGVNQELPARPIAGDPRAFTCRWTLEQNAQFRMVYTATDGEANADREWHPIDVRDDAAPTVILTTPGKDINMPENGTLMLEGRVSDDVGVKHLALHLRVAEEPSLVPIVYPLEAFGGAMPMEIDYLEVVALDQLKNAKGTNILLRAGLTIEYWLEAIDNADYPNPQGNIGKSPIYKILLTPAPTEPSAKKAQQGQRAQANQRKAEHDKAQQDKQKKDKPSDGNGGAKPNDPQQQADQLAKQNDATQKKLENAAQNQDNGKAKSADPQSGEKKGSPPPEPDSPKPQDKSQTPMSPDDAGNSKEQGDAKNQSGEAKDGGGEKKKSNDSKGERKEAPKDNPATAKSDGPNKMGNGPGTSKDAGMMGADGPPQPMPKNDMSDAGTPMPSAKGSLPPANEAQHGDAKGVEQNGPELADKNAPMELNAPPEGMAKSSKMNDAGGRKGEPRPGDGDPGQARDHEPRNDPRNPDMRELAKMLEELAKDDANANQVGAKFADLAKNATDPRVKDLAKEVLDKNGRDAKTGQVKKGPNRFGSGGQSDGISDEIKMTIANREFAARIGQMQLDDWKKQLTPDLLKRAGLTEADWQRFLKGRAAHDALVRQLNAKLIRKSAKELRADGSVRPSLGPTAVQNFGPNGDRIEFGNTTAPPEILDAERRYFQRKKAP